MLYLLHIIYSFVCVVVVMISEVYLKNISVLFILVIYMQLICIILG